MAGCLAGFEGYGRRRRRRQRVCHVGVGATARWLTRRASRKRGEKAREGEKAAAATQAAASQPSQRPAPESEEGRGRAGGTRGEFDDPRQPTRRRGPREQRGNSAATSRNARQARARGEPARPSADRTGPHIASRAVLRAPVRRARARTSAAFCLDLTVIRTRRANPLFGYIHTLMFTTAIRAPDRRADELTKSNKDVKQIVTLFD